MEWQDLQSEIKRFSEMSPEDTKNVIKSGIQTEFWKWLQSHLATKLQIMEFEVRHSGATKFDHLIELGEMNFGYKLLYSLLNLPENYLKSTNQVKEIEDKKKNIEALKNVLNAR